MATYFNSAIYSSIFFAICIFLPIRALDAFDIELNHFNLVDFNLTLDVDSRFDVNISVVRLEAVGKFGQDSSVKSASGELCIPKKYKASFTTGCKSTEYEGCINEFGKGKFVAIVDRGGCDMFDKAKVAHKATARGLIVVETASTTDPLDLKEYDHPPHSGKFQTYKTTSLDHSFIREASTRPKSDIPFVICTKAIGRELRAFVYNKSDFHLEMFDGGMHGTELRVPSSSLLLVFVAFIVLTIISMIWLIFYYVQRFRYHHHQDRVIGQVRKATKKAFRMMPTRILRDGDPELDSSFGRCAICLEAYKLWDMVRELPCSHIYHKSCVDAWLSRKPACPHCKSNVLKALGFDADYDWTCLDANSEPDAISLLDIVPQVVSVQIFAPNTAAPSRFITDLTSIPHNPPPYNDNSPTATASAPSSPLHSGERRGDGGGSKHRLNNNSQQGPSNTPRGGIGGDSQQNNQMTTTVATVEMPSSAHSPLGTAVIPKGGSKSRKQKSDAQNTGTGSGAGEPSVPVNVTLEVDTHNNMGSTGGASTSPGGGAKVGSSGPSSSTSANSTSSNSSTGRSLKWQIKKGVLAAIGGDSRA